MVWYMTMLNKQNLTVIVECISILNKEINDNTSTPACFEVYMKLLDVEMDVRKEPVLNE